MQFTAALAASLLLVSPAIAQRAAISTTLSPEAASAAFNDAVVNVCLPAVTGSGVGGLSAAAKSKLSPANDVLTRQQAGAAADETVWSLNAARGVVTIHEKPGRCVVSVYGPPAAPTIMGLGQILTASSGFERLAAPGGGLGQSLMRQGIMVQLAGSEPGMPGHKSRFSVVTASLFTR